MSVPALSVRGLHAEHPGVPVLTGVDLEVPRGALVAVLGASGGGKTTLLRAVAGFHPATAGTVELGGRLVSGTDEQGRTVHVPPERRRVGLVPQEGALFPHLSVAGNVAFGLDRRGRRSPRVAEVLELVGLAGLGARRPAELSGGQQQRVAVARALAPAPELVLLDEPFSALDAGLRAEVRDQVRQALRATGATAVLVTHDQQEALGSADLVAVLRAGRVVQAGSPQEIYREPVDLGVATFVGETVVLAGHAVDGCAETVLGRLPVTGDGGPGRVVLRPEQLRVAVAGGTGASGTVREVAFHGPDTTVVVAVGADATPVRCRARAHPPLRPGDAVTVTVRGVGRHYADPGLPQAVPLGSG